MPVGSGTMQRTASDGSPGSQARMLAGQTMLGSQSVGLGEMWMPVTKRLESVTST